MKELKGNMFSMDSDAMCITTNGFVKKSGACVMGKGCAKTLADMADYIPFMLGKLIKENGNITQLLCAKVQGDAFVAFPVKPISKIMTAPEDVVKHMRDKFKIGQTVPGWACVADKEIIVKSARELLVLADERNWKHVILPRAGCGAGELSWDEIKPLLEPILDDRFHVVTF